VTEKSEFNAEEWDTIVSGPAMAGAYLITAHKGGTVRETVSMAKVYTEARKAGGTGLLAQIVASNPPQPATRGQTVQEFRQGALDRLRAAVELLRARATPEENEEYAGFVREVAKTVAERHKEGGFLGIGGERVSETERAALAEIDEALGAS
jgi:hypothetical protein